MTRNRRMSTPPRVSNGVRRLLDAHIAEGTPSREETDRIWRRLRSCVEQAAQGESEQLVAGPSKTRRRTTVTWLVACAAAVVLAVLGLREGVRAFSRTSDAAPSAAASAAERQAPIDVSQRHKTEPEPPPRRESALPASIDVAKQASEPPPTQRAATKPTPTTRRSDAVEDRLRSLAGELRVLEAAQAALRQGDPEGALGLLGRHEREFEDAKLDEERRALRAIALCQAGRLRQGRGEAKVFVRSHPGSTLANRVRDTCELEH